MALLLRKSQDSLLPHKRAWGMIAQMKQGDELNSGTLDELDKRIISVLADNGRRPYRDIARDLGISEASVRQRVNRLIEQDLIRITAIGNLLSLGFDVVAQVLIKVKPGFVDTYAAKIAEYPSVRFVAVLFGGADIIFQCISNSTGDLHDFLRGELPRKLPEIFSIEIYTEVKTVKSSWTWEAWFDLKQANSA